MAPGRKRCFPGEHMFYIDYLAHLSLWLMVSYVRRSPSSLVVRCQQLLQKTSPPYVGHPISSDNDPISQKLLLKSEFYYRLHVAMGVAYSCLKYGVFIITWSDAIQISK